MNRTGLVAGGAVALLGLGYALWPRSSVEPAAAGEVAFVRTEGVTAATPAGPAATPRTEPEAVAATPPADRIPEDPDVQQSMFPPDSDPRVLYGRLRAEPIDKPWAERTQRGIEGAFVAIPYLQRDRSFRIACASTLCEIRGRSVEGASSDNTEVAMKALQGERLNAAFKALGLEHRSSSFGGDKGMEFTMYVRRQ